jgi:hypothetical protein
VLRGVTIHNYKLFLEYLLWCCHSKICCVALDVVLYDVTIHFFLLLIMCKLCQWVWICCFLKKHVHFDFVCSHCSPLSYCKIKQKNIKEYIEVCGPAVAVIFTANISHLKWTVPHSRKQNFLMKKSLAADSWNHCISHFMFLCFMEEFWCIYDACMTSYSRTFKCLVAMCAGACFHLPLSSSRW